MRKQDINTEDASQLADETLPLLKYKQRYSGHEIYKTKNKTKQKNRSKVNRRSDNLLFRSAAGQGICDVFEQHKNVCVVS